MKVWEMCNEIKGTNANINQIMSWAYNNKICPLDFAEALDAPEFEYVFSLIAHVVCSKNYCGGKCLMAFLESDLEG